MLGMVGFGKTSFKRLFPVLAVVFILSNTALLAQLNSAEGPRFRIVVTSY
jgi:hypothetical protein